MNGISVDAIARRAAATVSRRASFSALAAAALGVTTFPTPAVAKKRCSKKCDKRCATQSGPCQIAVADICNAQQNPDLCTGRCSACCPSLRNCDQVEVYESAKCLMRCVP